MKKLLCTLLASLFLTACGSPTSDFRSSGPTPDPETPVTGTPSPYEPPQGDGAQPVESRDGLLDVGPYGWDKAKASDDDRSVTVYYYAGVRECYGLDHVEVDYSKKKVTITLFEGRDPEAEVCIDLAQYFKTTVELEEPLDGRKLVDGAK